MKLAAVFLCVMCTAMCTNGSDGCRPVEEQTGTSLPPTILRNISTYHEVLEYSGDKPYTMSCCVVGHPKPHITWLKDNKPLISKKRVELKNNNQHLVFSRLIHGDSGIYTCIAKNSEGVRNYSIEAAIHEQPPSGAPSIILKYQPWKANVGSNATLSCHVVSGSKPTVAWFKMNGTKHVSMPQVPVIPSGSAAAKEYDSNLVIMNVTPEDAGVYKCQAKNGAGIQASEEVGNLTVDGEVAEPKKPKDSTKTAPEDKFLAKIVGGGLVLVVIILLAMSAVYIKRNKPEGWVTRKLIQMGVVQPFKCSAKTHGANGDDECICVVAWDVFISYNNNDRAWVMDVLHEKLKSTYNVCIDYQNFVLGGGVIDNIARCIWRSKTTLFVVSREFLKSGWSKVEFEITQDKIRRAQGSLIVIMLDDIKWQELPPILRRYTTGKIRVDCKDKKIQPTAWRRLSSLLGQSTASLSGSYEEECLIV